MNSAFPENAPATDPRVAFFDHHAPTWDQTGPDPAATLRRLRELNSRLGLRLDHTCFHKLLQK